MSEIKKNKIVEFRIVRPFVKPNANMVHPFLQSIKKEEKEKKDQIFTSSKKIQNVPISKDVEKIVLFNLISSNCDEIVIQKTFGLKKVIYFINSFQDQKNKENEEIKNFLKNKRKRRTIKSSKMENKYDTLLDFDKFMQKFESKEELNKFTKAEEISVKKEEDLKQNDNVKVIFKCENISFEKKIRKKREPQKRIIAKQIKVQKRGRIKKTETPSLPVNKIKKTRAYKKNLKRKTTLKRKSNVYDIDNFVIQNNAIRIHQKHHFLDIPIPIYKEINFEEDDMNNFDSDVEEVKKISFFLNCFLK